MAGISGTVGPSADLGICGRQVESIEPKGGVAAVCRAWGNHPDLHLTDYRDVRIELWTHAVGGLTENDFIVAPGAAPSPNFREGDRRAEFLHKVHHQLQLPVGVGRHALVDEAARGRGAQGQRAAMPFAS